MNTFKLGLFRAKLIERSKNPESTPPTLSEMDDVEEGDDDPVMKFVTQATMQASDSVRTEDSVVARVDRRPQDRTSALVIGARPWVAAGFDICRRTLESPTKVKLRSWDFAGMKLQKTNLIKF